RGGLAILPGAGLAGSGIPLDVGGVAPSQADDAARLVVEPGRTAVSQSQAGGIPADVRHRPAQASLTERTINDLPSTGARQRGLRRGVWPAGAPSRWAEPHHYHGHRLRVRRAGIALRRAHPLTSRESVGGAAISQF